MEGGGTKLDHLTRIEKQTGRQQVPEFEIPFAGQHLWDWFWELSNRRSSGGVGDSSFLLFSEIKAWIEVRKPLIHDWEIEILIKMDYAFMVARSELKKEPKKPKK